MLRAKLNLSYCWLLASLLLVTPFSYAEKAYFAGGCFWCMEKPYEKIDGVNEVVSGFTGGEVQNPTYDGDHEGHYEAIEVDYDPQKVSYQELLVAYWKNIDPFDAGGQFCDRGDAYRAAIFFTDEQQKQEAELSKQSYSELIASIDPALKVVTPVLPATQFWPVKEYHQNYYKKRPIRYRFFRSRCGRDSRLNEIADLVETAESPLDQKNSYRYK